MNDGVGESAKKADTVAMEGNMRLGWLMKTTSLGLAISMAPFPKALLNGSDGGRLLKDVSLNAGAAALRSHQGQQSDMRPLPTLTTSLQDALCVPSSPQVGSRFSMI
jgi:hypothetical protein